MRVISLFGLLLAVAACGSKTQSQSVVTSPRASASGSQSTAAPAAVTAAFLQAVADSNLAQMGELWGTAKGPASTTGEPTNWLQRLAIIHAYLKGGSSRVLGESPGAAGSGPDQVQFNVEVTRSGCGPKSVPFTLVRTKQGGWVVNTIDINAIGVPGRSCTTK